MVSQPKWLDVKNSLEEEGCRLVFWLALFFVDFVCL